MYWIKRHITPDGGLLLACCDAALLDTEYEEGEKLLSFPKSFYGEDEVSEEQLLRIIPEARVIMFGGKQAVLLGIAHKVIVEENVHTVDLIPHAHCVIDVGTFLEVPEELKEE